MVIFADFAPPASDNAIDWALAYAAAGMAVFPAANKRPLTEHGLKDASIDETQIRTWWTRSPFADVAWAVPAEIVVVDLDNKSGTDGFKDFMAREGAHPDGVTTPQATTPTGGRHLVYEANGATYRNNVKLDGSAIDLRTDGGYVVLPGPGNGRMWLKPLSTPIAQAPKWIAPAPAAENSPARRGASLHRRNALRRRSVGARLRGDQDSAQRRAGVHPQHGVLSPSAAWSAAAISRSRPRSRRSPAAANAMPAYRDPWRDLETKVRRAVTEGMREPRTTPDQSVPCEPDALIWYGDSPADAAELSGRRDASRNWPRHHRRPIRQRPRPSSAPISRPRSWSAATFAGKTVARRGGVLWLAAEGENEIETRIQAAVVARGADADDASAFRPAGLGRAWRSPTRTRSSG